MAESVIKIHARRSPSGASRWALCHAAPVREALLPDVRESSAAADWGTVAHDLSEGVLTTDDSFLVTRQDSRAIVDDRGRVTYVPADAPLWSGGHIVDAEMSECVERYVDYIRKVSLGGELFIEQRLSIEHITGEVGAKGTSDAVVLFPDEIAVFDLKGGYMRVMASYPLEGQNYTYAPDEIRKLTLTRDDVRMPNLQALMYAEAARYAHPDRTFKRVRLCIVQPRLNHVDEYVMEMDEFKVWVDWVREQALASQGENPRVVPSESTCQWCRCFPCAEATQLALETAVDDFEDKPREIDVGNIGLLKRLAPFVRAWADAVDTRVHETLAAGHPVAGWKLVGGDLGDRKWGSDDSVRAALADMGLKPEQYLNSKTISPAQAEKLVAGKRASPNKVITKEQWETLQSLIAPRAIGAPKVAPESDPRPSFVVDHAADFDDDISDYFN